MRNDEATPKVRICSYAADWLEYPEESFENRQSIIWSTGSATQEGDIQVFAVSTTLGEARHLAGNPRVDAVHSIWVAQSRPKPDWGNSQWPVQAKFKLLVKLHYPVPKVSLLRSGLLKRQWPRHWQGKILHKASDVRKLAELLAKSNPEQRREIFSALRVAG